jgi:GT2 family glycosyltransferase
MSPSLTCRIIVLNFNRRDLLERFMPSVVRAAAKSRFLCKVSVLDNASSDDSVHFLKKQFPTVQATVAAENKVLCSYNEAAKKAGEDILIFLNNDIETEEGFVDPLIEPFLKDPNVFFVATHGDCPAVSRRWGILSAQLGDAGYARRMQKPGMSFSAGVGAFDRKKFLELGGYDELYLPGRYEDVDLCYRGWKRGWKGLYAPESRKMHLGGASFEKTFDEKQTQALVFRNGILFMVKNVTDPAWMAQFWILTFLRLIVSALSLRWHYIDGFFEAMRRLPRAREAGKNIRSQFLISDRTVLAIAGTP